jgi:hypothetical protein
VKVPYDMRRVGIGIVIASMVSSCTQVGSCDYDLIANGWSRLGAPPAELVGGTSLKAYWFGDERGNVLACPEVRRGRYCHVYREVFALGADGSFRRDVIVCTK